MPVIIDCSVAVAWFAQTQAGAMTEKARLEVQENGGIAPFLFPVEFSNALLVLERRKKLTPLDIDLALSGLADIDLQIDEERLSNDPSTLVALARRHHLSVYDATYLELALRTGFPLATRDKLLAAAVKSAGANVFAP